MSLLDELGEKHGEANRAENLDYLQRVIGILTQVRGELYPYSDTYDGADDSAVRAICPAIEDLDESLRLDDFLCQSVMPCALAARLVLDENPPVSAYYERKYQELLARRLAQRARVFKPIHDVYGGVEVTGGGAISGGVVWP
jgi:hypothetical protein